MIYTPHHIKGNAHALWYNMGYGEKHSKTCTGINVDSSVNGHTNAKNIRRVSQHVWYIGGNSLCLTGSACTVTGVPTHLLLWAF